MVYYVYQYDTKHSGDWARMDTRHANIIVI